MLSRFTKFSGGGTDLSGLFTDNRLVKADGTGSLQNTGISVDDSDNVSGANTITTGLGSAATPGFGFNSFANTGLFAFERASLPVFAVSVNGIISGYITISQDGLTVDGQSNTVLGYLAAPSLDLTGGTTGAYHNLILGSEAAQAITSGYNNVYLGSRAAETNTTGFNNTIIGKEAGNQFTGSSVVFVGYRAGANSTGTNNLFFGVQCGQGLSGSATGSNNIFMGHNVAPTFTTAQQCVIVGSSSGSGLTSSLGSVLMGYLAGQNLSSGQDVIAIGRQALRQVTSQNFSVAVGALAGNVATSVEGVYMGYASGILVTSGAYNTLLGSRAGFTGVSLTTGSYNTLVGYSSQVSANNLSNSTALGANAIVTASNMVRLGSTSVTAISTSAPYIQDTGRAVVSTNYSTGRNNDATNQWQTNVPAGAGHEWSIADVKKLAIDSNGSTVANGRMQAAQGADVASSNDLTLGYDGNTFEITGTTQINAITTTNWQNGSEINLLFSSTPTVKHNTTGGAGTAVILLSGSGDFSATAGSMIKLLLCEIGGTQAWREVSRTLP